MIQSLNAVSPQWSTYAGRALRGLFFGPGHAWFGADGYAAAAAGVFGHAGFAGGGARDFNGATGWVAHPAAGHGYRCAYRHTHRRAAHHSSAFHWRYQPGPVFLSYGA